MRSSIGLSSLESRLQMIKFKNLKKNLKTGSITIS